MQNKGAIQVFAILLALACIFQLSFTLVTNRVEKKAKGYAGGDKQLERAYLDSLNGVVVYNMGIVKYTYAECKKREINLGLDLKGGMNVTMEVSIPDLLKAMSNYSIDTTFNLALTKSIEDQKTSQKNFVDIFVDNFEALAPGKKLASPLIFGHKEQERINLKMSNDEVRAELKKEAEISVERTYQVLLARIDNFGVTQPNIQKLEGSNRILVELPGVQDPNRVQQLLEAPAKLEFYTTFESKDIIPSLVKVNEMLGKLNKGIVDSTDTVQDSTQTAILDNKLDSTKKDSSGLVTNLAPNDTNKKNDSTGGLNQQMSQEQYMKENPLFAVLNLNISTDEATNQQYFNPGPVVGYALVKDTGKINAFLRMESAGSLLPKNLKLAWEQKSQTDESPYVPLIALKLEGRERTPVLSGDVITDASFSPDDKSGSFQVTMKMNAEGADKWADVTRKNVGNFIAIVLDDKVYSYPRVNDPITGGISQITGKFSFDDAKTLASVLKAGKLPTKTIIVEQAIVGPSLGQKAINAGLSSLFIAFIIILVYMAFYYGKGGITADLALFSNVFFLIGSLSSLGATLTLPGIAGIVLTIGMSVDANVLIFERIKEELRDGKGLRLALSDGYKRAYSAIIDSNVTTLLIALILMVFGAGPVKGFAIVLFVGLLTSMFSAIFISRLIFEWQLSRKQNITFSTKPTENFLRNININFVGKRKMYYIVSAILIAISIGAIAVKKFNLGVDLAGGRSYTVNFDNSNFTTTEISNALAGKFGSNPVVKYYGSTDRVKIITKYKFGESGEGVEEGIENDIYDALKGFYSTPVSKDDFSNKDNNIGLVESYKVGPTIARDIKVKSIYAVALSLILMFLYILIRFKGWQYGMGALIALAHDVIIVLGLFALFDGILPFSLEIDQAIIAAVLTVIGYSINDTVIIFDRIREYIGENKKGGMQDLINSALNSTLARTINTSVTVLFVLLISFLFGGEGVRGFAFAILIGVVVGTYSSIFIATPVVIDFAKKKKEK